MFKRTKSLSSKISRFHEQHCTDASFLNITQEYVLSYENTLKKLNHIFDKFEEMENKLKPLAEENPFDLGYKSLTPNNRRESIEDPQKNRRRSRSPMYNNYNPMPDPKKLEDLDKELLKDETKLNRYFNRNITYI